MYFNNDTNNTSINLNKKKQNKLLLIILVIIIATVIIIFFLTRKKTEYFITLNGDTDLVLYTGSEYIEDGFNAYDSNGKNYNNQVIISGDVNTSIAGNYIISYTFNDITENRYITIVPNIDKKTIFGLYGDSIIILPINSVFIDPGYYAIDSDYTTEYIKSKVKVTGNVDTSKKGTYKITYSLTNDNDISIVKERTVIVTNANFTLDYNPKEPTNSEIQITGQITDNYYDYLIYPDGTKETNRNILFTVTENNNYTFTMYLKDGSSSEETIEINNIDKIKPTGTCSGNYGSGKSNIIINAEDDNGIKQYQINDTIYTENNIELNEELSTVNVTIYDKAGNTEDITCNLNLSYNPPINPKGNEKIIQKIDTDTLKVWIEDKSTFYTTHIWVLDAYNQMKTAVPKKFGSLESPKKILENVISTHNYQNKAIVSVNGSGYVVKGTFDSQYAEANSGWNYTSVSPIVIVEGKVLRNFTNGKIPSTKHSTYGLKKDGYLEYYRFKVGTNLQTNINTAQRIINDGVQNTLAFNPVLVYNGKVTATDNSPNIRQGLCQIDKNNFVLVTNYSSRANGFSEKGLGEYMVKLGCQTAFNLDGGGSTTLLIKKRNSNISTIYGNYRGIADILYFHE